MDRRRQTREQELRQAGVDRISVSTNTDFVQPLIRYFKTRAAGGAR